MEQGASKKWVPVVIALIALVGVVIFVLAGMLRRDVNRGEVRDTEKKERSAFPALTDNATTDKVTQAPSGSQEGAQNPLAEEPDEFNLKDWLHKLGAVKQSPDDPQAGYEEVAQLIAELAQRIGTDPKLFAKVVKLARESEDVNHWGPSIFAISRSTSETKRDALLGIIRSGASVKKAWFAVVASLEGGEANGNILLPGLVNARTTNAKDLEVGRAAAELMLKSSDEDITAWLARAVHSVSDDPRVGEALTSVFVSPTSTDRVRRMAAFSLSRAVADNPGVYGAIKSVIATKQGSIGVLVDAVDLIALARTSESKHLLTQVIKDTSYPVTVRARAVNRFGRLDVDADVTSFLLRVYSGQPKPVKLEILETLKSSTDGGVDDRVKLLPRDNDTELRKLREELLLSLKNT